MSDHPPMEEYESCPDCGSSRIRTVCGPGRMKTIAGVTFEVPAHLAIPTCPDCGAEWMDGPMTEAMDVPFLAARTAQQVPRTGTSG
jgi:hypothetical protein